MKKTRPDKLKRILSLICSLILCIGIFSVADLKALQAEAATSIYLSNGTNVRNFSIGGTAVKSVISSDAGKMIESVSVSGRMVTIATYDNYTNAKKSATVKFYNKNGSCVDTVYLYQDGKYVSLSQTSPDKAVPFYGGTYQIYLTANCRVTSTSSVTVDSRTVQRASTDVVSSLVNKSGNSFGFTTNYGYTYTAVVHISVPTRLVKEPAGIGTAKGATGGGITFSAGRDCHPTFSWGQQSAKVTMTYAKNWLMSKDTVLTGQVPYPGTTVLYKVDSWGISISSLTYIQTDDIDFTKGIEVVYDGNYGSGTSSATVATGTMYAWTENGDIGWAKIGTVEFDYYNKTLTFSQEQSTQDSYVFNIT